MWICVYSVIHGTITTENIALTREQHSYKQVKTTGISNSTGEGIGFSGCLPFGEVSLHCFNTY